MLKAKQSPVHIDVELSSKCNLRCRFCHLSYFTPKENSQFTIEEFEEKIVPLLPQLDSITLFNKYEALTCRDFLPIFRRLSEFDVESYFSTNGLLLDDGILDAVVGKLKYLTVSITGFTRETYEQNMGIDGLEKVEEKLTKLNGLKKERNASLPILRISTVAMLDTIDELKLAVDFADQYDAVEGVQVTAFKAHGKELVELMPLNDPDGFKKVTAEAISYAEDKGVKFVLQSGSIAENEDDTSELGHRYCSMPWHRLSVQPNGDVYPCPMAYQPVGNFRNEKIDDIWKGQALARFRDGVNDPDNMNEDCSVCTHCRHRSLSRPEVNDYSDAATYPTGMVRKAAG